MVGDETVKLGYRMELKGEELSQRREVSGWGFTLKVKSNSGQGGLFGEAICCLCQRNQSPETIEG